MSDFSRLHGLQPTRILHPWIFQARVLEWGAIAFSKWEGMPTQRLKESGGVHGERERESESVREREREHVGERVSPFLLPS